ncbi:MAG: hypothetical protein ABF570_03865 [Acetobacter syzygii]
MAEYALLPMLCNPGAAGSSSAWNGALEPDLRIRTSPALKCMEPDVWNRGVEQAGEVAPCRGGLWRYVFSLLLFAVYPKADRV